MKRQLLILCLVLVAASGCEKIRQWKQKPTGTAAADRAAKTLPPRVLGYVAIRNSDSLLAVLKRAFDMPVVAPLVKKGLQKTLGVSNLDWLDMRRDIKLAMVQPDKSAPIIAVVLPIVDKAKLRAAVPTVKDVKDVGFSYRCGVTTFYVRPLGHYAVFALSPDAVSSGNGYSFLRVATRPVAATLELVISVDGLVKLVRGAAGQVLDARKTTSVVTAIGANVSVASIGVSEVSDALRITLLVTSHRDSPLDKSITVLSRRSFATAREKLTAIYRSAWRAVAPSLTDQWSDPSIETVARMLGMNPMDTTFLVAHAKRLHEMTEARVDVVFHADKPSSVEISYSGSHRDAFEILKVVWEMAKIILAKLPAVVPGYDQLRLPIVGMRLSEFGSLKDSLVKSIFEMSDQLPAKDAMQDKLRKLKDYFD